MRKIAFILLFYIATTAVYAQTSTYQLSSNILDVSTGMPAKKVPVKLGKLNEMIQMWKQVDKNITDENGRVKDFLDYNKAETGIYRLTFLVADYFKQQNTTSFYPFIEVVFQIRDKEHYHVPITISPYGYSTFKGN